VQRNRQSIDKRKGGLGRPILWLEINPNKGAVCDVVAGPDIRRANGDDASLSAAAPSPSVAEAVDPSPNREVVVGGDNREHIHRHRSCASRDRSGNQPFAPVRIARLLADC
jgi:hypothetical protein